MAYNQEFFEKVFSSERMNRYFDRYPTNPERAITHYECNLRLSESMYVSLSVFEVALRNAVCRELQKMTGRADWYNVSHTTPGLTSLNKYVSMAIHHISGRHEAITPDKIIAELTLGFWVSLFNNEYERILWKDLRRAFPFMPKQLRQRKNISAPLNRIRNFRNRIFHNEAICWNIDQVTKMHEEIIQMLGWINRDLPDWISEYDRFNKVAAEIKVELGWV